jgi:hypothetical protein
MPASPQKLQRRPVPTDPQGNSSPQMGARLIPYGDPEPAGQLKGQSGSDKERPHQLFDRQESALQGIYAALCEAKRKLNGSSLDDALNPTSYPEDVWRASYDMFEQLARLDAEVRSIEARMKSSHEKLVKNHSKELADLQKELKFKSEGGDSALMKVIASNQADMTQLTSSNMKLQEQLESMRSKHEREEAQLRSAYAEEEKRLRKELEEKRIELTRNAKDEVEKKLKKLKEKLSTIEKRHTDDQKKLREEIESQFAKDKQELEISKNSYIRGLENSKNDEIRNLRNTFERKTGELEGEVSLLKASQNTMIKEHKANLAKVEEDMRRQFNATIEKLTDDVAQHLADKESIEIRHQKQIESIQRANETNKAALLRKHDRELKAKEDELAVQKAGYDQRYKKAIDDHKRELDQLKSDHKREFDRFISAHKQAVQLLSDKNEQEQSRLNAELANFQAKADAKTQQLIEYYEAREKLAERNKEEEMRSLKENTEKLKVALVDRSHFKGMTDHQLSTKFQDLADDIDDIAMVKWDSNKKNEWPWPQHVLAKSENDRKLGHDIIKSSIWVILYQRIFCTPFRVLGDEGKSLEQQWAAASGYGKCASFLAHLLTIAVRRDKDGLEWPRPHLTTEKWRYQEIEKCLDALERGDADLRQAYESSLSNTVNELSRVVGSVSSLDSHTLKDINTFTRKAARLWLEMGTQRCRLRVVIPDSVRSAVQDTRRLKTAELVLMPGMLRIGNNEGASLDREEVVSGLKGEYRSFSVT